VTYRVVVSGRVQGVSFRASLREVALREGASGWVRNREDGAVEALLQGEEENVDAVLAWARLGPPGAHVSSVEREKLEAKPQAEGFRIIVPDWWEEEGEE
jgi:acylphosphatase